MKKFCLLLFLAIIHLVATSQFSSMPLNFPGNNYRTDYNSIVDSTTLWVGTIFNPPYVFSYSKAIRTTDGGDTWQFFTIPETGSQKVINNVCALDADTCFYVMWNGSGGSVWKTTDGGSSWNKKTSTQFSGGYPNFYHAFSADTGVVVGDPNGGYWEIYHTYDGGNSWIRVSSGDIPPNLTDETGISSSYSAAGNYIWFATTKGRCYRSSDRGLHWTVTTVTSEWLGYLFNVCFKDSLHGVFWEAYPVYKKCSASYPYNMFYTSNNGGLSWEVYELETNYDVRGFCKVPGVDEGFVITANDSTYNSNLTVMFTPDFFNTVAVVQTDIISSGFPLFLNKNLGWLSGPGLQNNNIYKFTGDLMSWVGAEGKDKDCQQIRVFPNPSISGAVLCVPPSFIHQACIVRIFKSDGQVITEKTIEIVKPCLQLDASHYANGIYYIQLLSEEQVSGISKWVISH